jgi:hypothetical protein
MKATQQIQGIKQTLMSFYAPALIDSMIAKLNNLELAIQSELIAAEQKGMTDAYAAMSATVDAKGEYYVEELTDDEKQAYYHEEEKKRLANQLNQQ